MAYLGSFGGRKPIAPLLDLLQVALETDPRSTLRVISDDPDGSFFEAAQSRGLVEAIQLGSLPSEDVGAALASCDIGVVFLAPGESAACQTPTKVGEYLAWGLPLVCNSVVGDVPALIERFGVGIVLDDLDLESMRAAFPEIMALAMDSELPAQAHAAARTAFSLERVSRLQVELVHEVMRG